MTPTSTDPSSVVDDMDTAPHTIFRWEAASGLEHTCYACTTKMNNPKARQTCYGVHSIPCFRYHQTMHAIGTSHNCFACIQADSLHETRHRKIAELVAEYKALEEESSMCNVKNKKSHPITLPLQERDPNAPLRPTTPTAAVGTSRLRRQTIATPLDIPIPNPTEHNQDPDSQEDRENEVGHSPDTSSTTTSSTSPNTTSSSTPRMTKADLRNAKRAAKSAKSKRKSLKNQTRLAHTVPVKQSDVERVGIVLHGDYGYVCTSTSNDTSTANGIGGAASKDTAPCRHPLATDKSIEDVIERNRRYVSNIQEHKAALLREIGGRRKMERRERVRKVQAQQHKDVIGKKGRGRALDEHNDEDAASCGDEDEGILIDAILAKLGISTPSSAAAPAASPTDSAPHTRHISKRHSISSTPSSPFSSSNSSSHNHGKLALLAQLRVAITEDLHKHENEQRQTCIRAGGFWRYVGRVVFERMCVIGERIDWRTGVIKREGEKDGDEGGGEGQGVEETEEEEEAEQEGKGEGDGVVGEGKAANGNPWEGRRDDRMGRGI